MAGIKWKQMIYIGSVGLLVLFVALSWGILFPSESKADNCKIQKFSHSHYPQQVIREEVYYFVGQPLRIQAIIEAEKISKQKQEKDEYQQYLKLKQKYSQTQKAGDPPNPPPPVPTNPDNPPANESDPPPLPPQPEPIKLLFVEKCSKCHSGATPKKQLTLTPDSHISLQRYKDSVDQMDFDKMPKGGPPLTSAEKSQIKSELLQLVQ